MSLIERLNGVFGNKNFFKQRSNSNLFLGKDFNSNALAKHNLAQDSFVQLNEFTTPAISNDDELALNQPVRFIRKYANDTIIKNALAKNPNITKILKENRLSTQYNLENLNSIIMSHLIPTAKTAQRLYSKMGHSQNEENYVHLTQAALLHDIGKCFIPSEILNKRGKLTPKERSVIQLHNQLSYEILKTTNLNPRVAQLAKEHHDYEKNVQRNHENQALTISDVYCALKEDRPYKKSLNDICAKTILYDMGANGSFDTRYINLLSA